jgi:fibronectin type 3 domain-containing protein
MAKCPPRSTAVFGLVIAACFALLAGCLPSARTPATAPVPANLTATAGDATVAVSWNASDGATGYNLRRASASGGPYTVIATLSATTYVDTAVTNGTTYYYVVSSIKGSAESGNSAQVSATPKAVLPQAPAGLVATPDNALVTLSWTAVSAATSYNVKRSTTAGGPYTQIGTATVATYADTTVTNGVTYYYVVSAVNAAGESANSAEASATPAIPTIPAAPSLSAAAGNAQATLNWSASTGASSYHLKRATTNGGPYTVIATQISTSFVDGSLTNNSNYYYVVSAVNSAGESPNSNQVVAVPTVSNPPPTVFGTWVNVTPSNADLTNPCVTTSTVGADPSAPANVFVEFSCAGIFKSTDYGATWSGPLNTGTNGVIVSDCAGGISVAASGTPGTPILYQSCIRGNAIGFWKSIDGGVNWTQYNVAPGGLRQDYYPPAVDPYDSNHLIMAAHEFDSVVESVDGGQTWTAVHIETGMLSNGRTGFIFFLNTGSASSTRGTWLWLGEQSGGGNGTWRTTDGGTNWLKVEKNEHLLGSSQIYQPDNNGVVYMAGAYSDLGFGVLRSADYGQTWTHEGAAATQNLMFGSPKNVYSMGIGGDNPLFQVAAQPGTGTWVYPGTPAALMQVTQAAVVNDGTSNILLGAFQAAGVWRYVEP